MSLGRESVELLSLFALHCITTWGGLGVYVAVQQHFGTVNYRPVQCVAWRGVHRIEGREKREKRENLNSSPFPWLIHRNHSHPATAVSSTNTLKSVGPPTLQPNRLLMSSGTPMLKILLLTYIWQFAPSVWRCENHQSSPLLFNHPPVLKHEVLSALFTLGHSVRLCDPLWREWDFARKPNGRF